MIKAVICFYSITLNMLAIAQPKEFEGRIVYKINIQSKATGVDDKIWHIVLATGENITSYVKQGNYKLITGRCDQYFIHDKQKVFFKFKAIDTLYYMDYSFDTSMVTNISKTGTGKTINGYSCNPIAIKTSNAERKYFYAPALYLNPEYDKDNTIGKLNILSRETSPYGLK